MTFKPKLGGLQALLKEDEAKKAEEAKQALLKKDNSDKPFEYAAPEKAINKNRIIFDDSGSMSGQKIVDAQDGCIEYMRNCQINDTAVAIHPMNYGRKGSYYSEDSQTDLTRLTTNLPALSVLVRDIRATGGTPLFHTLNEAAMTDPKANRYIVFSDGEPDEHGSFVDETIAKIKAQEVPCDTVLITDTYSQMSEAHPACVLMKRLADGTGGIFLIFDRTKVNFKQAFKYLAPTLRLQLAASTDMQKALQEGKLK